MSIMSKIREAKSNFNRKMETRKANYLTEENKRLAIEAENKKKLAKIAKENLAMKNRIRSDSASIEKASPSMLQKIGSGLSKAQGKKRKMGFSGFGGEGSKGIDFGGSRSDAFGFGSGRNVWGGGLGETKKVRKPKRREIVVRIR